MKYFACLCYFLFLILSASFGQSDTSKIGICQIPDKLFGKINRKMSGLNDALTKKTEKYLAILQKREANLKVQYSRIDSINSKSLFLSDPQAHYSAILNQLKSDSGKSLNYSGGYLPYSDSMNSVLKFVHQNPGITSASDSSAVIQSLSKMAKLQGNLSLADQLNLYVANRKEQIKEYLLQQVKIPSAISNIYKSYTQDSYYYNSQVQTYKELLNDPDRMFKEALAALDRIPSFQSFVQKNSYLALLFPSQDASNIANALNGLQTRDQLQQMIHTTIPTSESATNALGASVDNAKTELEDMQNRYLKYGQSGQNIDDPNFKPNGEKNKSFLKRLELGTNFQTQGSTYGIPAICNLDLSIGYRLKGANMIGIGIGYLVGLGRPINHIQISSQGIGFRSFFDIKLKASFYFSGGLEYNQVPLMLVGQSIPIKQWQTSGLAGLSKIIDIKSKMLKKTKVQLLWNFLSYYQMGPVQPFVFRVGYGL